jgi:hypothetical protein
MKEILVLTLALIRSLIRDFKNKIIKKVTKYLKKRVGK